MPRSQACIRLALPVLKFPESLFKDDPRRERRSRALAVLEAALAAADPATAVRRHLSRQGTTLRVNGQAYDLSQFRQVLVVGAGKGSGAMAQAV
ncbi:MAG: DUF4147 domain-containing protein, partial [Chloroflexi bacterium]|nr:DUF4147 domain-containing protein [Chloroflexota bacterium]